MNLSSAVLPLIMGNFLQIAIPIVIGIAAVVMVMAFLVGLFKSFYIKVEQGDALILNTMKGVKVYFHGGLVLPVIHKKEIMDISVKALTLERTAKNGLICEDNIRADISVTFYVRVNATVEDVKKVASLIGCKRASTKETLDELFSAKFSEALKTVGKQMQFTTLFTERDRFRERIISVIGEDLNGYALEDVAIDYLEQTPVESLDPDNILDAQGIRKITDLTAVEAMATNERIRNKEKTIKKQDVEARETILELERQQSDAEAKQKREIETIQAREEAETEKVRAEERLKFENARIRTEEELMVAEENKKRQVEIATKARERTIGVEEERVKRDQELESVERQRLVAIKGIEADKAVEIERKKIQEVIRERVAVEKTVAEEKEKIKDTVEIAGAERERQKHIIDAERKAKELQIAEVTAAEAKERAAKSLYEEMVLMAEGARIKAEKDAEAKKIMAEGIIAEQSAEGLAKVRVQEAEANAIEMTGRAEASANLERYKSDSEGTRLKGNADAEANSAKYKAEAEGIDIKAEAMKKFDGVGREHEEFKLRLDKEKAIELASIDVNRQIAEAQAEVLGEAMKTADIDIVGGDGQFLDNFFKSISLAKSVDGFVGKSTVVQALTDGDVSELGTKISALVTKSGLKSEDIKNLTLSALLARMAANTDSPEVASEAKDLQERVRGFGSIKDRTVQDLLAMWLAK